MILTVFAGIAEFERSLIHQRISTEREAAKKRGVRFGRPPKLTADQVALGRRLVEEGTSVRGRPPPFSSATTPRSIGPCRPRSPPSHNPVHGLSGLVPSPL